MISNAMFLYVFAGDQRFATHVDATRRVDPGGTLRNTTACQTYVVEVRALWYAMACVSARRATKLLMRAYQNHALSTANVSIGGTVETTAGRVLKSKVEPKLSCDARDLENKLRSAFPVSAFPWEAPGLCGRTEWGRGAAAPSC